MSEEQKHTVRDEAWEEYLSTGIDPTGGELGPDFDQESEDGGRDMMNPPSGSGKGLSGTSLILLLVGLVIFILLGVNAVEKAHRGKVHREQALRQMEEEQYQSELRKREQLDKALEEAIAQADDKEARSERVRNLLQSGRGLYGEGYRTRTSSGSTVPAGVDLPKRGTAYGDGFWDGYYEGFDDADGFNEYGFKYDESTKDYKGKARSEYARGYKAGYKIGWDEGIEQREDNDYYDVQ